jgi:hypothetical protein
MIPKVPLCRYCFAAGQDVCFAFCNPDMVRASIWQVNTYADLVRALDVVCSPHNIIRKECCHHFILLNWGRLGLGNRKKVPDCVANAFRVVFPSPDGNYMGHRDSYSTSPLRRDEESSDTSSATQLQEEDNVIVEIDVTLSADEEELKKVVTQALRPGYKKKIMSLSRLILPFLRMRNNWWCLKRKTMCL